MAKKCEICSEKIQEDELGKLQGTVIKIKSSGKKNELKYICSQCQKEGKDRGLKKSG